MNISKVYMNPKTGQRETVHSIRRALELMKSGWIPTEVTITVSSDEINTKGQVKS